MLVGSRRAGQAAGATRGRSGERPARCTENRPRKIASPHSTQARSGQSAPCPSTHPGAPNICCRPQVWQSRISVQVTRVPPGRFHMLDDVCLDDTVPSP